MAWSFSNSVGYRGYAKITPTGGEAATLLATGGNINLTQDPLTSQGVWGATPDVAAQIVAWAYNYLRLEGSISYDLTKGPVYNAIRAFAFASREDGADIIMKPDGGNGFDGTGYCSGATFSCSEGQIVTGDINFVGDADGGNAIIADGEDKAGQDGSQYEEIFGSGGTTETTHEETSTSMTIENGEVTNVESSSSFSTETTGTVAGEGAVIAYWATKVNGVDDAISWNVSYNSDIQLLKCCTGSAEPPIGADYVLLGDMSGDGSFTVFTLKGDFEPENYHKVKTNFNIKVGNAGTILIPYAIINSGSTAIQTGASYITADFNFTAVGDGQKGPVSLSYGAE